MGIGIWLGIGDWKREKCPERVRRAKVGVTVVGGVVGAQIVGARVSAGDGAVAIGDGTARWYSQRHYCAAAKFLSVFYGRKKRPEPRRR